MAPDTQIPMDELPAPARRALEGAGYGTLEDLTRVSEEEVAGLHGIGPSAVKVLQKALEDHGLAFLEP